MFGLRGKPSAEALAGSGPTTTYPAPPSATATPQAIASIAGGTAEPTTPAAKPESRTAQVAGFDVSPGYATPAANPTPTNMAAAKANGIYSGTKSADFGPPAVPKTTPVGHKPSGYSFGSKTKAPKPETTPASSALESPSAYAKASTPATPSESLTSSATTAFAPPATSSYTTPPRSSLGGYTLPTDSPAVAAITPPTPPEPATTAEIESANEFAPPPATAPDYSTASAAGAIKSPSSTNDSAEKSGSGYSPGSTGAAVYPTGDVTPTTSGSFFR